MAVDILFFGGFKDGEIALDVTDAKTNAYVGGSPATIGANGAKLSVSPDIIGVFKNSSALDLQGDIQADDVVQDAYILTTIIYGTNKLRLFGDVDDAVPFATPPTGGGGVYALLDKLYVDASGVWDNAAAVAGDVPGFKVVGIVGDTANPTSLDVYQTPFGLASVV